MENICSNCKTNITPVWRRYTLTVEEAAGYYHIGENKLRSLIDEGKCYTASDHFSVQRAGFVL